MRGGKRKTTKVLIIRILQIIYLIRQSFQNYEHIINNNLTTCYPTVSSGVYGNSGDKMSKDHIKCSGKG